MIHITVIGHAYYVYFLIVKAYFPFLVEATSAGVKLSMSPDIDLMIGDSTRLNCHYTGVSDISSFVLKWEYRKFGDLTGSLIYTYDGNKGEYYWHGYKPQKFDRIETDVRKEQIIQLKQAELEDEGTYFCYLEYYVGGFFEGDASMTITIIGKSVYTFV